VLVAGQARYYAGKGEWRYQNGSVIVTGGLDKVTKIMSSEYDAIYVQEATEISEDEWEHLTTRLRRTTTPTSRSSVAATRLDPILAKETAEAQRLTLISSAHEITRSSTMSAPAPTPRPAQPI